MYQVESVYSNSTFYSINIKIDLKCALRVALCLGIQKLSMLEVWFITVWLPCTSTPG